MASIGAESQVITYTFDPNRIFTDAGAEASLKQYGPYSVHARAAVRAFAARVLDAYGFGAQAVAITMHNNGPHYSASAYLPGHVFAKDAAKVNIEPRTNARNFFFVTPSMFYDTLAGAQLNVVLQSNATVTDDGSLSYYAAQQDKPYINIEAAAESGATGDQVLAQLDMIERMYASVFR